MESSLVALQVEAYSDRPYPRFPGMAALELKFLGDFEVLRDGRPLTLPPSRKTRALLAYLSLQPRRFRREHLCELLWEIPDDPRGSLRWSLSKLRRLVDDDGHPRLVADRSSVGIEAGDVSIDVVELRALARGGFQSRSLDDLEAIAAGYRGNFLEGLEFSNFHEFHSWCVAEREQALRDREALLIELLRRLEDDPLRALPHARALVGLSPYEERYRAALIRLLTTAHRPDEADQQYRLGLRILKEAGIEPSAAMLAARRPPRIDRPPPRAQEIPAAPGAPIAPSGEPAPRGRAGRVLVGREAEVAQITRTFEYGVARRRAGLMILRGAPGLGKTRLMDHLIELARQSEALVLRAGAYETDAFRPFGLWIDALRDLGEGHVEEIFGGGEEANRDRLFARLNDFVTREATSRPLVLLFDDVHWCDESSAAALHYVVRMNRDRPVLGVVAARDGELRDNVPMLAALRGLRRERMLSEIELEPLNASDTAALIKAVVPGAKAGRLAAEAGGNPLLAIELARAEIRGSSGSSLSELVQDWLARFGVEGAEVLRWAAVLNPRIEVGKIADFTNVDMVTVGEVLEDARQRAMLRGDGAELRFAHDCIAQAVYADVSPLRRQVMHRRIAEALEAEATPDLARAAELAHHALQSGDRALAARALVAAGRLCLRFFANDDAQSLARRGLQFAGQMPEPERVCLEIDLNDILMAAEPLEDWEAAAEHYAELAGKALDHGAVEHARLGYHMASWLRWEHGHWNAAREQTMQAMRVARGGFDQVQIVGMAETAKCLVMLERDLGQAGAMLMEASARARRERVTHHAIPTGLGMLRFHENRLDEAEELFQEARTLCRSCGDRLNEYLAVEYLAMLCLQQGRHDEAEQRCQELEALAERLREGSEGPFARAMIGLCAFQREDEPAGLDAALAELRAADAKHRLAYVLSRAAVVECQRGRHDRGVERAAEALEYAEVLERATEMLISSAVLSRCYLAAGDSQQAARLRAEVVRLQNAGAAAWSAEITARVLADATRAEAQRA